MAGRVSQEVIEGFIVATPSARVSQEVLESLAVATPNIRASQEVLESLLTIDAKAHVSQVVIEALVVRIVVPEMPPIYPNDLPGLAFDVTWSPQFFNLPTQTAASGADIDLALAAYPLHTFELTYAFLRDGDIAPGTSEFKRMMGFFLALGGTVGRFLFRNPDDNSVQGQVIGTTDGVNHLFGPLVRTFGTEDASGTEPVGYLDLTKPFKLYLDGVWQDPSTYTIITTAPVDQQIQFNGVPTAGQVMTVDMSYFYYCKFADNASTFSKFLDQIWELQKITIHSCRAGT